MFLHIGTHKTGTTSFQGWASDNSDALARTTGLQYYEGLYGSNHYEIPMLCLRVNRSMPMRVSRPDWCLEEWQSQAEAHVRGQAARSARSLLVSAEAMSYMRHTDEIERLVDLLRPRRIVAVAVLREPSSFLRSYRQLMLDFGFPPSPFRESFAYVADDSWLVDYDSLLGAYRDVLGADSVLSLSYESAVERHGSVIPAIFDAIGFDASRLPAWQGFHRNTTGSPRAKGAARRLRGLRNRHGV